MSSAPQPSSLEDAILTTPSTVLRKLLLRMVRTSSTARTTVTGHLLTPIAGQAAGTKRRKYETCKNCGEDYNVTENSVEACGYHRGYKEIDDSRDFWIEHDEFRDGFIIRLKDDPDFDEGFMWSCCEGKISSPGCVERAHIAEDPRKRARGY